MALTPELILLGVLVGMILAGLLQHHFACITLGRGAFTWPSRCESCGSQRPMSEHIPLISTGKLCSTCSHKLSPIILILQVSIITFSVWAFTTLSPLYAAQASLLWFSLLGIAYMDLRRWVIPNQFLAYLLFASLVGILFGPQEFRQSLMGLLVAGFVSLLIILPQRFGEDDGTLSLGDVKLCFVVALWLGWILVTYTLLLATILALISWLISGLVKGFSTKRRVPFGPFVALSTMIFGMGRLMDPQFVSHLLTFRF